MPYQIEFLPQTLDQLRALPRDARRLKDIEDARTIERAKRANGNKPRVPRAKVKKELRLD